MAPYFLVFVHVFPSRNDDLDLDMNVASVLESFVKYMSEVWSQHPQIQSLLDTTCVLTFFPALFQVSEILSLISPFTFRISLFSLLMLL